MPIELGDKIVTALQADTTLRSLTTGGTTTASRIYEYRPGLLDEIALDESTNRAYLIYQEEDTGPSPAAHQALVVSPSVTFSFLCVGVTERDARLLVDALMILFIGNNVSSTSFKAERIAWLGSSPMDLSVSRENIFLREARIELQTIKRLTPLAGTGTL
ncbi:MAG TPA: hypothetical protein VMX74_14760 [Pirellulales bacterium]|nr:hypothetical protein [Pirellulales bacterium]